MTLRLLILRGLPLWLSSRAARLALPLFVVVFFAYGMWSSQYSTGFHDYFGGRLPRSDSSSWIVGTVGAVRGVKQEWVVRRPLNVVFNAPIIRLALRQGRDPLVFTLRIKRGLALVAIISLCLALSGVFHYYANAGLAILLGAVLFGRSFDSISYLFGKSVGYTHGTELNGFIFCTYAVASLVAGLRLCRPGSRLRCGLSFVVFVPGFLLLSIAALIRPGSLLLIPLVAVAILINITGVAIWLRPPSIGSFAAKISLIVVLAFSCIGPPLLMQQASFSVMKTDCGAIGGNQGYTLYGMSQGSNWTLGIREAKRLHLGRCERSINEKLLKLGKAEIISNPIPIFVLAGANLVHRLLSLLSYPMQWPFWLLVLVTALRARSRSILLQVFKADWLLRIVFLVGVAGWVGLELFQLFFYQEAELRPVLAYAAFPLMAAIALIQFCFRSLFLSSSEGLARPISCPVAKGCLFRRVQQMLLVGPSVLLTLLLLGGYGLVLRPDPLFAASGSEFVSGVIRVSPSSSGTYVDYSTFLTQISENYRLQTPVSPCAAGAPYNVQYTRARLPGQFPLGGVRVTCDASD